MSETLVIFIMIASGGATAIYHYSLAKKYPPKKLFYLLITFVFFVFFTQMLFTVNIIKNPLIETIKNIAFISIISVICCFFISFLYYIEYKKDKY